MVADTNGTFLSTIAPFLKAQPPAGQKAALLARAGELSWAASSKKRFFEAWMGTQTSTPLLPKMGCPFHKDPEATRAWTVPSLQNGPWTVPGYCVANVPLLSPRPADRPTVAALLDLSAPGRGADLATRPQTVAHLRFIFAAHIAAETL